MIHCTPCNEHCYCHEQRYKYFRSRSLLFRFFFRPLEDARLKVRVSLLSIPYHSQLLYNMVIVISIVQEQKYVITLLRTAHVQATMPSPLKYNNIFNTKYCIRSRLVYVIALKSYCLTIVIILITITQLPPKLN